MTALIAFLLLASSPDPLPQKQAEEVFAAGLLERQNAALARPLFQQAAKLYEQLIEQGARNPQVQQNLGTAWLLADDLPHAILAYRRGLQLDPANQSLRTCLEGSRERVVYPPGTNLGRQLPQVRPPWLPWIPVFWLLAGGFLLFSLFCILLTRFLMAWRTLDLVWALIVGLGAFAIGYLCWQDWRDQDFDRRFPLVVIAQDGVILRKGNNQNFPPLLDTPLNRGVEARLLRKRGQWLQIELAGGQTGWVPMHLALTS